MDPDELTLALCSLPSAPPVSATEVYCPQCRAIEGADCTGARPRAGFHLLRQYLFAMLSHSRLPGAGHGWRYGKVDRTRFTARSVRPRTPNGSGDLDQEAFFSLAQSPRWPEGMFSLSMTVTRPGAVDLDGPLTSFSKQVTYLPAEQRRALYLAVTAAPDTALAHQMVGTLTSESAPGSRSHAQWLFSVAKWDDPVHRYMTPDGRYFFGEHVEPYPGAWPAPVVIAAHGGDLSPVQMLDG